MTVFGSRPNESNSHGRRAVTQHERIAEPNLSLARPDGRTALERDCFTTQPRGIQVPAVVKLPGENANAGRRTDQLTHVMDLMPTFLSVAGADYPDVYHGESIVPLQGVSLLPLLRGESSAEEEPRELGWSAYGMDAYRKGNWKALRLPEPYVNGDWQLYDLAADPLNCMTVPQNFRTA